MIGNWRHFADEEVAGLDKELVAGLDVGREKAGVPFVITRGLSTPAENACLHGAVADSAHLTGHAVDLAAGDDETLNRIIYGLCVAGLGDRFGIYYTSDPTNPNKFIPHHVHVDNDKTKPQQVTWALKEQN